MDRCQNFVKPWFGNSRFFSNFFLSRFEKVNKMKKMKFSVASLYLKEIVIVCNIFEQKHFFFGKNDLYEYLPHTILRNWYKICVYRFNLTQKKEMDLCCLGNFANLLVILGITLKSYLLTCLIGGLPLLCMVEVGVLPTDIYNLQFEMFEIWQKWK
jgi:hypothetical protein